jgi:hypothetical protein
MAAALREQALESIQAKTSWRFAEARRFGCWFGAYSTWLRKAVGMAFGEVIRKRAASAAYLSFSEPEHSFNVGAIDGSKSGKNGGTPLNHLLLRPNSRLRHSLPQIHIKAAVFVINLRNLLEILLPNASRVGNKVRRSLE